MFIVFGGLPGTGKSTIARALSRKLHAVYLRVDEIEQALRVVRGTNEPIGPEGYVVAQALARSNLELGHTVIADSVNALLITREGWRAVAARAGVPLLEVAIVCSDVAEHRRRVETRESRSESSIDGAPLPSWADVSARAFTAWPEANLTLDTATLSVDDAVRELVEGLRPRATANPMS